MQLLLGNDGGHARIGIMPRRPSFRRSPSRGQARGHMRAGWLKWRVPILLLIVTAVWWFGYRPLIEERGWVEVRERFVLCSGTGERAAGCVVDGDTVVLGFGNQQRRIRITGFDTPELDGACPAEITKAREAQQRLRDWLEQGPFEWDGGQDPPRDQYGRELREVRRTFDDGSREYLADYMLANGLAAQSGWDAPTVNWCA